MRGFIDRHTTVDADSYVDSVDAGSPGSLRWHRAPCTLTSTARKQPPATLRHNKAKRTSAFKCPAEGPAATVPTQKIWTHGWDPKARRDRTAESQKRGEIIRLSATRKHGKLRVPVVDGPRFPRKSTELAVARSISAACRAFGSQPCGFAVLLALSRVITSFPAACSNFPRGDRRRRSFSGTLECWSASRFVPDVVPQLPADVASYCWTLPTCCDSK